MRLCKKCLQPYGDDVPTCANCKNSNTIEITDPTTPVVVATVGGPDKARASAMLADINVPFVEKPIKKIISGAIITGDHSFDCDILVPFSAYDKAYDTLVGIGVINPPEDSFEEDELPELSNEQEPLEQENIEEITVTKNDVQQGEETFAPMSDSKRFWVRVVSVLLFAGVVAAVIFGTDFIINLVKSLFGGQ
ncbi:MAG: hypothetical protein LBM65_03840 [Oscillospiraceae bacterium]|jgi:hypothetical protein|nr:hypothetical protein [Oscillospiraceae bacterium]